MRIIFTPLRYRCRYPLKEEQVRTRVEDTPNYQGNAVVNYASHGVPYTRMIEHKHFEMSVR